MRVNFNEIQAVEVRLELRGDALVRGQRNWDIHGDKVPRFCPPVPCAKNADAEGD